MKYEKMLDIAETEYRMDVREKPLLHNDGLIYGRRCAIRKDISTAEKVGTLAEEIGHRQLSVGDITDYSDPNNWKQEVKARTFGYQLAVTPEDLINAYEHGCQSCYEIASFLDVTEQYLTDAIERFRQIFGLYQRYGDFLIMFEPNLGIIKFQ